MSIQHARLELPLKMLMVQYGHAPKSDRWKDMECPFCHKPKGAGVFHGKSGDLFKCHHTSCPSGPKALDEVGYVAAVSGLSRKEAFKQYLKMAGVWQEEGYAPSVLPGQRARKKPDPIENSPTTESGAEGAPASANEFPAEAGMPGPEPLGGEDGDPAASLAAFTEQGDGGSGEPAGGEPGGGDGDQGDPPPGEPPGDPPPASGGDDESSDWPKKLRILEQFYKATRLTEADEADLWQRRGLKPEVCEALGFATNDQANKDALLNLCQMATDELLVKAGLWGQSEGEEPKPNAQFYGWGVVGKKPGADDIEWGWKEDGKCNPILIPYFDDRGQLVHLRPHKGMIKDGLPRLWVARDPKQLANPERDVAVICEGEFKAAAAWQVLRDRVAVASMPGITMSKHWLVEREIEDWLGLVKPKVVVVAFDNEEKGDPALPGFKADRRKRYDAEIWARFLALKLRRDGLTVKVARLPDEWRDANGKADWDGALARRMAECRELAGDALCEAKIRIGTDFWRVISTARLVSELKQGGRFDSDVEQIIQSGVAKLFHARELPVGGDREFGIAQKIQKNLARLDLPSGVRFFLKQLAITYRKTRSRFYNLKPLKEATREQWLVRSNIARSKHDHAAEWVCGIVLKGVPNIISDFRLDAYFVLIRQDGKRDRMVRLCSVLGQQSVLVPWDARSMSRPSDFREWLFNCGNFGWSGNERDLQALQKDLNVEVAFQDVAQVVAYGWHEESQLWFFRDCALGRGTSGEPLVIKPDEWGIYWLDGKGYLLGEKGKENQTFRQGSPMMSPELRLLGQGLRLDTFKFGIELVPTPVTEDELFRAFLREACERLRLAAGGYEAYLAVSLMLAYGVAPELFAKYGQFPGLWPNGQTASGKTTFASWLMEFWGFRNRDSGLGLKSNVTAVGLQIALEQYSNLPVWADEYEGDAAIQEGLKGIIHASFNREIPSKWSPNGEMRTIRTNLIVSGETTPGRAATRSRFALVQMAVEKRPGTKSDQLENWSWLQEHRKLFFVFGREILRRRKEFAEALLFHLRQWKEAPDVKAIEERTKFVYGVGYAGFMAMLTLWETHGAQELEGYRRFLKQHCVEAVDNVNVSINANRFWTDLMSAHAAGEFGHTKGEVSRYFKVASVYAPHPPLAPNQGGWYSFRLYINYNSVVSILRQFLRRQGQDFPLAVTDLRDQLSKRGYWLAPKNPSDGHRQRFGSVSATTRCWCIDVDKHEMGYRMVEDEVLDSARLGPDGVMLSPKDYGDPRKGELFQIIEVLQREEGS